MAEVVVRAAEDDLQGIDVTDPFVQQAIEHVEQKYGSYVAIAESGGEQTTWASEQEGAAEIHVVPADPVTREVNSTALRRELGDTAAEDEVLADIHEAIDAERAGPADDEHDIEDLVDLDDDQ